MPTKGNIQLRNGTILFNGLSAGVATISEAEITTEGDFVEKDFKVINLPSAYRKYRKTLKRIKGLYKLERKLKNENS